MPRSESDVEATLTQYLSRSGGPGWEVSGLRQLALGWETDVYGFRAAGGGLAAPRDLVLRVYPGQKVDERAAAEAHALRRLGALAYPVPELLAFEPDRARRGPYRSRLPAPMTSTSSP